MIQGISHITLTVQDLERAAHILKSIFDAEEIYSSGDETYSVEKEKFFLIAGQWFALMAGQPGQKSTYEHIAFKVDSADLKLCQERIIALGLEIKEGRSRVEGEGESLYFYDEDGHLFELHTGTLEERLVRYRAGGV